MDAGALQMLHDARNQDVFAVANGVNFNLSTHQVLVDQYRIFNLGTGDDAHILADVRFLIGDFHALTAQYIRRTNQYRIAQTIRNLNSFFLGKYENECTMDGVHPNDLGFTLMAEGIESEIRRALRVSGASLD